jgi:hypothetical protein
MVALEKIVSEMLDDKMLLSEAFTRLLAEDATCSRIIRGEGDILRFIHAHQGRVYVHSTTGADTWLACHRQRPDAAARNLQPASRVDKVFIQQCISTLEVILKDAPDITMLLSDAVEFLDRKDLAFCELIRNQGGIERFLQEHGRSRVSLLEGPSDAWLWCPHHTAETTMNKKETELVGECLSVLQRILSRKPGFKMLLRRVEPLLQGWVTPVFNFIKRRGGIQRFIRAHGQSSLAILEIDHEWWLRCQPPPSTESYTSAPVAAVGQAQAAHPADVKGGGAAMACGTHCSGLDVACGEDDIAAADPCEDQHKAVSAASSEEQASPHDLDTPECAPFEHASAKSDSALFESEAAVQPFRGLGPAADAHGAARDALLDECACALQNAVVKEAGSSTSLASIKIILEKRNPNYVPLIESLGGMEHFVRARTSCSLVRDAWDNVWVICPSTATEPMTTGHMDEGGVTSTATEPISSGHMDEGAVASTATEPISSGHMDEGAVADCIAALEVILAEAPEGKLSLGSFEAAFFDEEHLAPYHQLIEHEGGVSHFVRAHAEGRIYLHNEAGADVWLACHPPRPNGAPRELQVSLGDAKSNPVQRCISALEAIVSDAPGGRLYISSVGAPLYARDPTYRKLVKSLGGMQKFVREHCQGRLSFSDVDSSVRLAHQRRNLRTPSISTAQAMPSVEGDPVQRCISALEAIVSDAPGGRLEIGVVGNSLYKKEPNFHELVTSLGGLQRLVREHCQGRLSFSDADRHVCLVDQKRNLRTPSIPTAQAMPSAKGGDPVQRCISALEAIVSDAPGGRLHICSVGGPLYARDPTYREHVKSLGGMQQFVRAHCQGRLLFSETSSMVRLLRQHQSSTGPCAPSHRATKQLQADSMIAQCVSALQKIVSEAPDGEMLVAPAATLLYTQDPAYRSLVKSLGGMHRFVQLQCQNWISLFTRASAAWISCQECAFSGSSLALPQTENKGGDTRVEHGVPVACGVGEARIEPCCARNISVASTASPAVGQAAGRQSEGLEVDGSVLSPTDASTAQSPPLAEHMMARQCILALDDIVNSIPDGAMLLSSVAPALDARDSMYRPYIESQGGMQRFVTLYADQVQGRLAIISLKGAEPWLISLSNEA